MVFLKTVFWSRCVYGMKTEYKRYISNIQAGESPRRFGVIIIKLFIIDDFAARYIGAADSKLANKFIDQVRCLSYVWQILLNLEQIPNRIRLAKLVVMMQVSL